MAIIDRIKYDGPPNGAQWLIYKYPSEEFVLGAQLIVNQGQEALLFLGGEALELYGRGRHTLSTGNLPIFNRLIKFPFGNKTPFTAEIYYINKTITYNLKWGTSTPIPLEDAKYGFFVDIQSRMQYGICIKDSRLFISRIIGAIPLGKVINDIVIRDFFYGIITVKIKSIISVYMIRKKISFLEISMYLSEISEIIKRTLEEEFVMLGIELIHLSLETITPTDKDIEKLKTYKEHIILGKK